MRSSLFLVVIFLCGCSQTDSQHEKKVKKAPIEELHADTLYAPNDTFSVQFSYIDSEPYYYQVSSADTIDLGTDGGEGLSVTIYYDKDSLVIPYHNTPYAQVHYIPIKSPNGLTIYRMHFNSVYSIFSKDYMDAHDGVVTVEIPEVYELANIIWILSSKATTVVADIDTANDYYKRVKGYFAPYLEHPVFDIFSFPDSLNGIKYYDFRENSYTFRFVDESSELICDGPYYYVMGDDWDTFSSLFSEHIDLIEDFVAQSNYRDFYRKNYGYYQRLIKRQKELMPVEEMWTWLEREFPDRQFNSYKVVFSPLITGSHSTQQYAEYVNKSLYREAIMFVCGPELYDIRKKLSEQEKQGLMSGIVFTEIDHNYVNPVSYRFKEEIEDVMGDRSVWVADGQATWYSDPLSVFNEYMTHALFCLYIQESYDEATAEYVIERRIDLMEKRRGFVKFREFNKLLMEVDKRYPDEKVAQLYPQLLKKLRGVK